MRHYDVWRRLGDPEAVTRRYVAQAEECSVEGCGKEPDARGLCLMHYKRLRRHGTTAPRFRGVVVDGKRLCSRCERDVPVEEFKSRPWCADCWNEDNRQRQHVRRALQSGVDSERFDRREICERDGWICQLCKRCIDPGLAFPHPDSASLDHIIPLARGGSHTRANAQAAHLDCNRRKWAHLTEEVHSG